MKLTYNPDGKYKIIQFTDLHFSRFPFNEDTLKTVEMIKKTIPALSPDLIILTGDNVWSDDDYESIPRYKSNEDILKLFDSFGVPVAVTYGNHDTEVVDFNRSDLRAMIKTHLKNAVPAKNSMIVNDLESYTFEIYDSKGEEIKNVIYVIDSGDYPNPKIGEYDWVKPQQVEWFRKTAKMYHKGDGVKRNIVFQHMPLPEYWKSVRTIVSGDFAEYYADIDTYMISSPVLNSGLFLSMLLDGETWGISVGHDHENNFDSLLHGLHLMYGRSSGYNTYGEIPKGVRVFELEEKDNSINTYTVKYDDL